MNMHIYIFERELLNDLHLKTGLQRTNKHTRHHPGGWMTVLKSELRTVYNLSSIAIDAIVGTVRSILINNAIHCPECETYAYTHTHARILALLSKKR